jgi:hypothetical protein
VRARTLALAGALVLAASAPLSFADAAAATSAVSAPITQPVTRAARGNEGSVFSLHARSGVEQFETTIRELLRRPAPSRTFTVASPVARVLVFAPRSPARALSTTTITVIRDRFLQRRGPPAFAG